MSNGLELRSRRPFSAAAAAALIAAAALVGGTAAFALSGTPFEGADGDLTQSLPAGVDWDGYAASPALNVGIDTPSGQNDDALSGKEDYPVPGIVYGSIPKNKSDLLRFYVVHDRRDVAGVDRDYLYLAWIRDNTLGTANIDFEFNQAEAISGNGMTPVRTPGDMLVTFEFGSGGNAVSLGLARWTETGPCEASASAPCWGPIMPLTGVAEGAINDADAFDPIEGVTLAAQTFGEATIDLTAAGVFDADACTSFGSAYVKSRSSDSFTSSLKDMIRPMDVQVSNCSTIRIVKNAVPDDQQSFSFTASGGLDPSAFALQDDGDETDGQQSSIEFVDKLEGAFSVSEQPADGWDLTDVSCTAGGTPDMGTDGTYTGTVDIDIELTDQVTCTYTNTKRGRILVDQVTVPSGDPQSFGFTMSDGAGDSLASFSLADASALYDSGTLSAGAYSLAQLDDGPEWDLTSAVCDDGSSPDAITLDPGETVVCTFTNTKRGTILVQVDTTPAGDPQLFDLTLTGGPSALAQAFQLTDVSPAHDSGYVLPGSPYAAAQTLPAGWHEQSASCDDGSAVGAIDVAPGEVVTCTFVNVKMSRIVVQKETDPDGDPKAFDFTLTGGPSAANQAFSLTDAGAPHDSGYLMPGSGYTVQEALDASSPRPAWDLTEIDCSSAVGGSDMSFSGSGVDATVFEDGDDAVTIDLAAGDEVSCIFTNTRRGTVIVVEDTIPDGPRDFSFTLDDGSIVESFQLDDDGDETDDAATGRLPSSRSTDGLMPGRVDVSQADPRPEFDLIGLVCTDSSGASVGTASVSAGAAAFTLLPGETVTCVFTNAQRGQMVVDKFVVNVATCDDGFDPRALPFDFTSSWGAAFQLSHGQSHTSPLLPAYNDHWASESPPAGWQVTSQCTYPDGSLSSGGMTVSVDLPPAALVTCTFTNEMLLHPGSSGFWRNWDNHYAQDEFDRLLVEAFEGRPVYVGLFDGFGQLVPGASDVVDAIYDFGGGETESDQKVMAELTTATLNLGVSKSDDPEVRAMQKNDQICWDCIVDLSGIPGADELVDTWSASLILGEPTVRHVIEVAEATWTGDLSIPEWSFGPLTDSEKSTLAKMLEGLNQGTVLEADPCSYPDVRTCLTMPGLPEATYMTWYSTYLEVSSGTPPYTWTVTDGKLPAGVTLNELTGELSGTPQNRGLFSFTVTITDSGSPERSVSHTYLLIVNLEPDIIYFDLPNGTMGSWYHEQLAGTGGTDPMSWAVVDGALPDGLSLDPATGVISGTVVDSKPAKSYTSTFTIECTDANGATDLETFSISVDPPATDSCDTSMGVPTGIPHLEVSEQVTYAMLDWTAVPNASAYDVVRGDLVALRATGDFAATTESCIADDRTTTSLVVGDMAAPGGAHFYLVRAVNCNGNGSYDMGDVGQAIPRDADIAASGADCP